MSIPPSTPNVGRFTGLVLGFVVFVCVTMIGGTGYLKYQLDRSESVLAAPDNALGSDQDMFDRLRRDLGFGGFLGFAQAYVASHDASGLAQMKAEIKSADEIVAHLPDKTPAETRHELTAITSAFDAALQKISPPTGAMGDFNSGDLASLYAALPILDARVDAANAETRLAAQNKMQFWAMLLTLVSWCSLIIAAACAAGIYLTLRDKHSAPMRALAQSIQNMARGDMRTAIWGTERQDMIGELARAVDIARYHFSHLPDLSLLSEQGPVRMRFEGGSRSLFEAMMKAISRDSEHIREQSTTLTEIVTHQKIAITALSEKVESIMQTILQRGQNGDQQIRLAISEMVGSAENLKNAHAHAADQLNRLIPHIQDRAQGLAEITHITGKQISNTLLSLSASEMGLKQNAEQVKETLSKISSTADDLGERLFGAINLLQASGKVLAETTEDIKSRMAENSGPAVQEISLAPLADRLEQITSQLTSMQDKLDAPALPPPPQDNSVVTAAIADLRTNLQEDLYRLSEKIVSSIPVPSDQPTPEAIAMPLELSVQLNMIGQRLTAFEQNMLALQRTVEAEAAKPASKPVSTLPPELQKQLMDQWFQMSAQIEASRASLIEAVSDQIDKMETRLAGRSTQTLSRTAADYSTQRQIEQQTQILSELVATLGVLDAHMQQIKTEMNAKSG